MKQFVMVLAVVGMCGVSVMLVVRGTRPSLFARAAPAPLVDAGPPEVRRVPVADVLPLQVGGRALVIDVRVEKSFAEGHVAGAINVPVDEVEARGVELLRLASGRPIVTYCSCVHEHTSAVAAQELTAAGGKDVRALLGGYPAWVAAGGPVER